MQTPAGTTGPDGTVIRYGDGASGHVLTVYLDPRCPYCKRMENRLGALMEEVADEGRVALEYHLASFIDATVGGSGSRHAIAALGAALDEGGARRFLHYLRVLYAGQPRESADDFADPEVLVGLADEVEGLRTPAFEEKVREGVYLPWARAVGAAFYVSGVSGTPTVLLDGRPVPVLSPEGYAVTPEAFLAELPG